MASIAPIKADDRMAAKLLCLTLAEFRRLVTEGYLPAGHDLAPGYPRWDVEELRSIGRAEPFEGDFEP